MRKTSISVLLVAALLVSGPLFAKKKKKPPKAEFSYYLLALSWAPEFCAQHGSKDPGECGTGKKIGFVVHGLWPQGENGRGPENCGSASPVSQSIVQVMLNYIPTASLIQHEWKTHGTCSGLSVADYFAAVRKARDGLKIPDEFKAPAQVLNLGPPAIESAFAAANPTYPKEAFRTYCTVGALQEARVCFDKDLSPRACTVSAGECSLPSIKVPPVR
jgi:ribonuclease T2